MELHRNRTLRQVARALMAIVVCCEVAIADDQIVLNNAGQVFRIVESGRYRRSIFVNGKHG